MTDFIKANRDTFFGAAAFFAAMGAIIMVFVLTWEMVPRALRPEHCETGIPGAFWCGVVLTLVGVLIATGTLLGPQRDELATEPERSRVSFGRALVGLGYIFCLDGVLNLIAFAGFAWTGVLKDIFPSTVGTNKAAEEAGTIAAIRLIVSLGMAVLGALFFITNSLIDKRQRVEVYDHYKFWSGTWFRLGEAVLFTVVFFLAMRREAPGSDQLLPLIALLLGMFVTTGETLVFGLAQRVLRGAAALVGIEEAARRSPRVTGVSKVTAPATAGGTAVTTVTIDGEAFTQITGSVVLDGHVLPTATWSDTRVTFVLPAQHPDDTAWPAAPATRVVQVGVVANGQNSNTMPLTIP